MSLYSILLIGAWVLGSGVVAYICDNLGRKLGKKRLTMWGLRPRHTAMVITVMTGMGIAILTVCLVALVNVDARRALFSVGQINQELMVLGKRESALTTFNRTLEKRNRNAEDRARTSEENAQVASKKEMAATAKSTAALVKLNAANKQRDQVEKKLVSARVRLARLEVNRIQLTTQVHERQARLAALSHTLAGVSERYRLAVARVKQTQNKLGQTGNILGDTLRELGASLQELSDSRNELQATQKKSEELSTQIAADTKNLGRVTTELRQGQANLQILQEKLQQTAISAVVSRTTPFAFPVGQEIARRVIYRPDDETEVKAEIEKLMDAADETASAQGAKPDEDSHRSVKLVPINFPIGGQNLETWDEDKQISEAAKQIAQNHEDVVVRVMTGVNSLADEPVQSYLEVRPNRLVFRRSAVVARLMVNGSQSDAKVLETLIDLLQTKVRAEALRAGLLPPPSGSLGEINWEQLLGAVHELRERNALAEIQVITQADIWTSDPLDVRFALQT